MLKEINKNYYIPNKILIHLNNEKKEIIDYFQSKLNYIQVKKILFYFIFIKKY